MKHKFRKERGELLSLMICENINRQKMATKLGKSERTISRYLSEDGFKDLTLDQIDTLVSYLGRELVIKFE